MKLSAASLAVMNEAPLSDPVTELRFGALEWNFRLATSSTPKAAREVDVKAEGVARPLAGCVTLARGVEDSDSFG